MCRLFGLSGGSEPVAASFWLLDAPDSLARQSHREPDGTGLGWFDPDRRPHLVKQPIAAYEDRAFARVARTVQATTFVSHVRFASTGSLERRNTHPFEQDGRLFAHNGVVEDLGALEAHLGRAGLRHVHGDTDSERVFALITHEIAAHGGDVTEGITAAVGWIAAELGVLALNCVLTAPGELWALRYPETHDLFVLERSGGGAGFTGTSSHGTRVRSLRTAERDAVVVASERMDGDPGWRQFGSGELIHVGPDLALTSRTVIPGPPAHPLRLEDLGERARSSQTA